MNRLCVPGLMILLSVGLCLAEGGPYPVVETPQPFEDGTAPMAINPNDGKPFRSPYMHGTFQSVDTAELIIIGRRDQQPIAFVIKGIFPVYDVGRKIMSLSGLNIGDKLKVHFQKNPDNTMTVLAVYRIES